MYYIIFDLEFNQEYDSLKVNKNVKNPNCPFEIIQIGAVKLDENLREISTLDRVIKPEIYTEIHPLVKRITNLTMDQLIKGKPFKEVYKDFIDFIKNDRSVLCVWGMADMKELFRNIEYYELDTSVLTKEYINIQFFASKHFNCPKGTNIGLRNTVELLNIPLKNEFHNAFNDAYYTTEIFKKIYDKKFKPKIYNVDKYLRKKRQRNSTIIKSH